MKKRSVANDKPFKTTGSEIDASSEKLAEDLTLAPLDNPPTFELDQGAGVEKTKLNEAVEILEQADHWDLISLDPDSDKK